MRIGWNFHLIRRLQRQLIRQVLDLEILVLNFHRRADMNLDGEDSFQRTTVFVEIDQVGGGVSIDPVLVMISFHENAVVVPLAGGEVFDWHGADNPGLTFRIDDNPLAGVAEDAAAFLLVEHAVVIGVVGNDVTLVAGRDVEPEIGSHLASVLKAAVAAGGDLDFYAEIEVADGRAFPTDEAVHLERAVRHAGEGTVFD